MDVHLLPFIVFVYQTDPRFHPSSILIFHDVVELVEVVLVLLLSGFVSTPVRNHEFNMI